MEKDTKMIWIAVILGVLIAASAVVFFRGFTSEPNMSAEVFMHEALQACGKHPLLEFHYSASTGATWVCGK